MITKFKVFSGVFSVNLNNGIIVLKLSYNDKEKPIKVDLITDEHIYDNLSVTVPDSKDLDSNEFFLNTEIDKRIIKELLEQGFITKTNKKTMSGDIETISYKIII